MHKYHVGFHHYYLLRDFGEDFSEDAMKKAESEGAYSAMSRASRARDTTQKQRKEMNERLADLVIRVVCTMRNSGRIVNNVNKGDSVYSDSKYTGNHIVIFEIQLKHPHEMMGIDNSFE